MSTLFKRIWESLSEILWKKTQNVNVEKLPQQNRERPAVTFNGTINGPIIFAENIHIEHGELFLSPETYVQNGLPPTSHSV